MPPWTTTDLKTLEAKQLESDDIALYAGGYYSNRHDDKTYVLLADADYASTTIHTLSPDGESEHLFDITGWSTEISRVR